MLSSLILWAVPCPNDLGWTLIAFAEATPYLLEPVPIWKLQRSTWCERRRAHEVWAFIELARWRGALG